MLYQPPTNPPATSNRSPPVPTNSVSTQELSDKGKLAKSAALTLLEDTSWPPESKEAAQKLVQTIKVLPDFPRDISPVKDSAEKFIYVLEAVQASLKNASEKYGRKERGFRDGIKHTISSLRPGKCTEILQTCREDIEKVSTTLRSRLESMAPIGSTSLESVEHSEIPSSLQDQPTTPQFEMSRAPESSVSSGLQTKAAEQPATEKLATSQQASTQASPTGLPDDQETPSPVRDTVLIAARKTFKTVEAVSGTIPAVGDFVGVAAKVGLAFVEMIQTMDKNEDVAKELASHTSNLSKYLEHIKKSNAEDGDELGAHIHDLHRELERIQNKVSRWNSLGRFKKAFSASDHAEELKGHQDTIQNALEEIQLLVSLKTSDLVIELKNSELRAERRRLLDRLGDGNYGARGSSIEDVVCLPGTRVEILDRINQWIKDTSTSAERVLWIRGMAGRGKSTIASTVAHSWASKGSCAIFHFRRGQNASDGQFICALARQLGKGLVPEVKNAILACVKENEDIAKERLDQKFKTLLVGSLGKLQDHAHPIIIIVDALDECENVAEAVRFVRLIDRHSTLLPTNVKFLLTCRPEAPLLVALEPRKWHAEDLDSMSHVREDITRFIQHSLAQIREDHDLPENWASSAHIEGMVEMSQGLFQWARTAITYIDERAPVQRLQELLQHSSKWGQLDYLYRQILSKAFDEAAKHSMREQLLSWLLETLVVAPYPVSLEVVAFLHADHEIFEGQEDTVQFLRDDLLADLNSLLYIPSSQREPLRLMHTSIRDLLVNRKRCDQHYFIEPGQAHRRLAGISLEIMERDLKKNICGLSDLSKANSEVQDAVESHVPKGLQYCCRSWSIHLTTGIPWSETNGATASVALSKFRTISEEKLLAWLEVMSLIGATNEALKIVKQVHKWLEQWPPEMAGGDLSPLWNDIQRFIALSLEPISFGALHIYASALPHCPWETKLWAKYGGQATAWVLNGKQRQSWPADIWALSLGSFAWMTVFSPDGGVLACHLVGGTVRWLDAQTGASVDNPLTCHKDRIKFEFASPDGEVLASVSDDNTVRLWDVRTGAQLGDPLTGHTHSIMSVVFSPNSKVLASVSDDKTVRLWDARTGAQLGDPLTGHTQTIRSVVFSPDGKVLASVSEDHKVRLWDVRTGAQLGDRLTGPTQSIAPVVFSPDSKVLASVSDDNTVRLWDARTGAPLGDPLAGHTKTITTVVFSPNSKVLASVSGDKTVRLWDALTGAQLGDPLTGHTQSITSAVFSPDSKVLASGSDDQTVRLWDARSGAQLGDPLTGHTQTIRSVVFSPDGKVLASASGDQTVRLWDASTWAQLGDPLTGHTQWISSVVFSPDSKVLASTSFDGTVRLWDAGAGAGHMGDPLIGHTQSIRSVVFSPNSKVLVSVSNDNTVRLWDTRTGAQLGDRLTGPTQSIAPVVFSPDSKVLASVSDHNTVRLWDARTGAQLGDPLTGHTQSITSVVFSPNSKVLASVSDDKTVRLWDALTGALLGDPLTGHMQTIRSVVFSPDGKVLASALGDQTVRLWDASTWAQLGDPLTGHKLLITFVIFSPDSKVLASASFDGTVRLWDGRTGAHLGDPLTGHPWCVMSVVFSPDSKILASVLFDGTARLWDARTGAQLGDALTGHTQSIGSVVFSPDSKVLASGSFEGAVRSWDARTGAQLDDRRTDLAQRITSVVFSPDSKVLASQINGTVRLWDARTGARLGDPLSGPNEKWLRLAGSLNKFTVKPSPQSNWIPSGSRCLLWLPVHYRRDSSTKILFSRGRLALISNGILSIVDVSEFSKSQLSAEGSLDLPAIEAVAAHSLFSKLR